MDLVEASLLRRPSEANPDDFVLILLRKRVHIVSDGVYLVGCESCQIYNGEIVLFQEAAVDRAQEFRFVPVLRGLWLTHQVVTAALIVGQLGALVRAFCEGSSRHLRKRGQPLSC